MATGKRMMHTNAWVVVRKTKLEQWKSLDLWERLEPETRGNPPEISANEMALLNHMPERNAVLQMFSDDAGSRLGSVWGMSKEELEKIKAVKIVAFWTWKGGDKICALDSSIKWNGNQIRKHMPDGQTIEDVIVIAGQPPREFPEERSPNTRRKKIGNKRRHRQ